MSVITYTAKRRVLPLHVIGNPYTLEFAASVIDRTSSVIRKVSRSRGGHQEVLLTREEVLWDVWVEFIDTAGILQWREFLASVAAGESLSFDPYGWVANPDNPLVCVLESESHPEERHTTTPLVAIKMRLRER